MRSLSVIYLVDASDDKIKSFVTVKADARLATFAKNIYAKIRRKSPYHILNARDLTEAEGSFISSQSVDISTALKDERGTDKHMLYTRALTFWKTWSLLANLRHNGSTITNDVDNDAYLVVFTESYKLCKLKQNSTNTCREIFAGG